MSRNGIRLSGERLEEFLLSQSKKQHCASLEDFYAAIGYGGVLLSRIVPRMKEDYLRQVRSEEEIQPEDVVTVPHRHNNGGVIIDGMDNCLVKFARCCNPVPGDDIIGFITRGYGRIHPQARLHQRTAGAGARAGAGALGARLLGG